MKIKLGINVDHVATLRQARGTDYPDPVVAALLAEAAGSDSVVIHLREDRRHIRERDVLLIREAINIPLNLEMATSKDIVDFALDLCPDQATLVPEKRQELTTEGGLDLIKTYKKTSQAVKKLKKAGSKVSLFIDPFKNQVKAACDLGADNIEFNTARYVEAKTAKQLQTEFKRLKETSLLATKKGFFVAAGHGLDYENTKKILKIKEIKELNIGHSIISRSIFIGIVAAIEEMIDLIKDKK